MTGLQLPDRNPAETQKRLLFGIQEARPGRPPPWVRAAISKVALHLAGDIQDFADIPLDLSQVPAFHRRIYEVLRAIAAGKTCSYSELADLAGSPQAARAVGQAMAKNPLTLIVPCHRVLAQGKKAGGFSAYGGLETKTRLLALEGISLAPKRSLVRNSGRLSFDPESAIQILSRKDAKLARVIKRVGPFVLRPERKQSPFASLAQSIVYQQLSGVAAARIFERLCALFSEGLHPQALLEHSPEVLRKVGLSSSKVLSLRDLAQHTLSGTVPTARQAQSLSDETLIERLAAVRGIGPWTVQMMLIFRLGRPDVLPSDDYGVRKGFALVYGKNELPTPKQLLAHGERWRPFRTVASWYLWRVLDLPSLARPRAS